MAVEHMAKAALATLSPALLADRTADLDTMLHLTGLGHLAKCSPHEIKTLGAHEACLRCARVIPDFTYTHNADQALFVARNGGVHLALATEEVARQSARIMVRLLEPLIKTMNLDRNEFWADMCSVADTLLDERASQINAAAEMKLAAARSRLEDRLAGLGPDERQLVLKALSRPITYYGRDEEPYECPVCHVLRRYVANSSTMDSPRFTGNRQARTSSTSRERPSIRSPMRRCSSVGSAVSNSTMTRCLPPTWRPSTLAIHATASPGNSTNPTDVDLGPVVVALAHVQRRSDSQTVA